MSTEQPVLLRAEGLPNLRDLGGLPLEGGGQTRHGRLLRSDSPHRLTDNGRSALLDAGVRTVVDLRTGAERSGNPSLLTDVSGVHCVHAPIFEDDAPFPEGLVSNTDVYCWWVEERAAGVGAALEAIAESAGVPVLVHCHAGKDRTGLVVALVLRLAGVPPDAVADDYALSGVMLAEMLAEGLRRHRERNDATEDQLDRWFSVRRETMLDALERIDGRLGPPERVVASLGLSDVRRERLRTLLTAESWPPDDRQAASSL